MRNEFGTWSSFVQVAGGGGANFYSGVCVYVNEYESRAQATQNDCSEKITRCSCAPVPANGFGIVCRNAMTVLVTGSDTGQC